ncbi:MAG: TIGR02147 family protein [Bdellovibrionota bacterium]
MLQSELIKRCERNPSYSLRSFAKQLDIDPATLSSIISQKRPITEKTIKKLGTKLSLSPDELQNYISQKSTNELYAEFTQDLFAATSDWYHDAILELTRIKNFNPDFTWIAKTLDISVNQVRAAAERLCRLELLEIAPNGQWLDKSRFNSNTLDSDFSSAAMRKYQMQILEKSMKALEDLPRTERDHTSMMVCGNAKDLKKAKELITEFRHNLAAFFQRKNIASEHVYQISVSLFPITKLETTNKIIKKNKRRTK